MPSTAWPSIWPSRSFISRAALLVKVTDKISPGRARPMLRMWAIREVSTRVLPVPAPASTQHGSVQRLDRFALLGIESRKILRSRGRARTRGDTTRRRLVVGDALMGQLVRLGHANRLPPTMAPWGREGEPS